MRRLASVLLVLAALAGGDARAQTIRLVADRTPLDAVLHQLAGQSGVDIVYAERLVTGRAVTGRYLGDDPESALRTILRGSGLRAEQLRPGQFVIVSAVPTPGLQPIAYRGTLTGTVVDAETGEVLPGAHVVLVGLELVAVTNPSGYFALPDLPAGAYRLRVSYVGYQKEEQEVSVYPESPALPPTIRLRPVPLSSGPAVVEGTEGERSDLESVPGSDPLDVRRAAAVPALWGERDLAGALAWLPGVGREAGGELVVRGSEASFNRYLLDGAPVLHPWHAAGLFSTFQAEALKSVRLYKGSLPAEYGSGLSAVLDAEMRDGDEREAAGVAALSPVAVRAVGEVPLGRGASLVLSGRRTYLDLLFSPQQQPGQTVLADEAEAARALGYSFFDLSAKLTLRPSPLHRFSLSVYEGGDDLDARLPDAAESAPARLRHRWGNRVVSARYRYLAGRRVFLTAAGYFSRYRATEQALAPLGRSYRVRLAETGATVDADYYYSLQHQIRAGARLVGRSFEGTLEEAAAPATNALGTDAPETDAVRAVEAVAYVQDTWQPNAQWQVQPGLRAELLGPSAVLSVSPRLNVRYVVARDLAVVKAGLSRQTQTLHRLRERTSAAYDLALSRWVPASATVRPAVGWQAAAGLEATPRPWLALSLDVYGRHFGDILLPVRERAADEAPGAALAAFAPGSGRSFGVEATAEAERGRWRLGLSYAFARSQVRPLGEVYRRADYDAPHAAKALLQGRVQRWSLSLATTVRSGYPVTVPVVAVPVAGDPLRALPVNNGRLPVYARVDLAVGYGFRALGLAWDASLQAYNLLNRRNTVGQRFAPDAPAAPVAEVYGLPILPMGSLTARW